MEEVRKAVPALAAAMQRGGNRVVSVAARRQALPALSRRSPGAGAGEGGERRGGRRGGGEGMGGMGGGSGAFSAKDLENAKLPPPVDPENQLEVLLRPGLLADVEIILEKIPNAINIPELRPSSRKTASTFVYVRKGNKWEERVDEAAEAQRDRDGHRRAECKPARRSPWPIPMRSRATRRNPIRRGAVGSMPGGGRS